MAYYQKNMLSIRSRQLLANLFAELLIISQQIESFKTILQSMPAFDSLALFRALDHDEKGYLLERDIQRIIGTTHRKLITYAYSWLDQLKLGQVTKSEFSLFLLNQNQIATTFQTIQYRQLQDVNAQINVFAEMLLRIVSGEMRLIQIRRSLLQAHDYSLEAVKLALSKNQNICQQEVFVFLHNYAIECSMQQIHTAIQYIGKRGVIEKEQLLWIVEGLENKGKYLHQVKKANKTQTKGKQQKNNKSFQIQHSPIIRQNQKIFKNIINRYKECQNKYHQIDNLLVESEMKLLSTNEQQHRLSMMRIIRIKDVQKEINEKRRLERQNERNRVQPPFAVTLKQLNKSCVQHVVNENSHPIAASIRRKYANLHNLNSLAEVESQRKSLGSSNISAHLRQSEVSLAECKRMRELIKQQRTNHSLVKIPQFGYVSPKKQQRGEGKLMTSATNQMWS